MRGVESDPTQPFDEAFGPGVARRLGLSFRALEIAADVARGNIERSSACDENMREILANSLAAREGLRRRRRHVRRARVEGHGFMQSGHQRVQPSRAVA